MNKYWKALLYGNAKTKRILITALLLMILVLAGGILAATGAGALWALIAVFAAIFDIVLLQSVKFGEVELQELQAKQKSVKERTFDSISDITEDDFNQLLISYKVHREHVQIMIDSYPKEEIKQVPACLWQEKGYLMFLAFQEKPKYFAIPIREADVITYQRHVEVSSEGEYEQMKKPSFLNAAYQKYLPVYTERNRRGRKVMTKNLYVLAPGIVVTNTSLKNLCKVVSAPVSFEGIIDDRFSRYYKEAYRMKILLLDQIYTPVEYKEQISGLLKQMAESGETEESFLEDMERMVQARVVTREVANYFIEYRKKQSGGRRGK